jgi:hypothetical protein
LQTRTRMAIICATLTLVSGDEGPLTTLLSHSARALAAAASGDTT